MVMLTTYESKLKTSGFSTGLLMATINIQVQCPVTSVGLAIVYSLN